MLLTKANVLVALISVALPCLSRAQSNGNGPNPQAAAPARALHSSKSDWNISSKARDSQVWSSVEVITDLATGQQQERPKSFVELGTGMNYQDRNGQWQPTREEFRVTPNGFAVAEFGPHMLIVGNNINAADAVDFLTSDGKRFRSAPLAVAYFDPVTGGNVILATIRDTVGELTGPNQVTFRSAFEGLDASIRITYRKSGMSSDLILHEVPPDPALFGLSPESHLELYTEFVESPAPGISERVLREEQDPDRRKALKQPDFKDQILDYGEYKIGTGAAFEINADPNAPKIPVGKRLEVIEGRTILIEAVEHHEAKKLLAGLPVRDDLLRGDRKPIMAAAGRAAAVASRTFPQRTASNLPQKAIERAAIDYNPKNAFVLDYSLLTGATNFTFKCDTTYYVSSEVLLYGTTVLEHAVVKSTNWTTYNRIQLKGPIQCLTGPYRPIVFTSMHDDAVGQILPWSTGNPNTNFYGNPALEVDYFTSGQFANLSHIRVNYAAMGISFFGGTPSGGNTHVLSHVQFMRTQVPLAVYYTDLRARNILVYQADRVVGPSDTAITRFEHLTAHQANALNLNTNATIYLTNSILAHITNSPVYIGSNNATTNSSAFKMVGGGRHYLATNTLRNLGTNTINAQLLAELKTMTTFPPIVYSNVTLTTPTTLAPQAQRDTDTPDLGYHYAPLDYAFGGSHANTNLTFTAGTAVGWFRTTNGWFHAGHGLHMADRQIVTFEGEVMNPNYWVRCSVAQEGGTGLWDGGFGPGGITSWADQYAYDVTRAAEIRARFTRFSVLASDSYAFRDDWGYLTVRLTDCELWGGGAGGYILSAFMTNCLVERALVGQITGWPGCQFHMRNTTHKSGTFTISRTSGPIPVSARDCAFDGTAITVNDAYASNPTYTDYDYNAFITGGSYTTPTGAHDVLVTNFNWQTGPLGRYYLWTNTPPSALINAGSVTANTRGLYHYTMSLSQVKETNSVVDIGYHYIALNSFNQPVDTDADLVPDWQEDLNGNGIVDGGEASWTVTTLDNDGDGLTNAQDILLGLNPVRADTDGDGVPDGSEDYDGDSLSNYRELNVLASDPKVKNSQHAAVNDGVFFLGAAMGVGGTPAVLSFPSFPGNNVQLTLTGGDGSYDLYFAENLPNATDEFLWWVYQVGPPNRPNPPNNPIVFTQTAPGTPTGFFQAGKSRKANGDIEDMDSDGANDGYEVIVLRTIVGAPNSDGDAALDGADAFPLHQEAILDTDGDFKPDIIIPGAIHDPKTPLLVEDLDDDNDGVPDEVENARGSISTDPTSLPPMDFYVKITDTTCGVGGQGLGTQDSPFRTIQAAINAAPAPSPNLSVYTIIHVATNRYTGAGNQNINFLGKRILLLAEKGPDNTVIDCTSAPAPSNGFILQNSEDEYTRIIGFTIWNAPSSGIACNNSTSAIVNCVFTNNATSGGNGGAVICTGTASPTFINCKFLKNGTATSVGGAVHTSGTGSPRFTHCTFFDNNRTVSGGQLNFQTGTTGLVNNCIVWTTVGNNAEIVTAGTGKATVMWSDVKQASGKFTGLLNINADPLLDGNGRLTLTTTTTSPCIDVGTINGPGLSPERATKTRTDMDNEARTQRFAVPAPPTNVIHSASSDIGADEFVYRLILPLDGSGFSIVDEASGVTFLGESGGLSKFAVVDDELDNNVQILHVNNQGLLDTTSPLQTITTALDLKDAEGVTFVPTGTSAGLYSISSQTKRNWYHTVDFDMCGFLDPPTSDYDVERTRVFRFGINATFDWNGAAPTLYSSEAVASEPFAVNFNAANGLIPHIRNQFNAAGAPFTADTTTAPFVMIAFNTCSNFSQPPDGVRFAKGASLPVFGTSLGDSVPANGELGAGSHTHNNTYLPGSLAVNQDVWYRIWSFSQPGAVSTRVYSKRPITGRIRTTPTLPKLYINEIQSNNPDTVELHNPLGVPVNITLFKIQDRGLFNLGQFYSFPTDTIIPARGYATFLANDLTGGNNLPFGLDAGSGDDLRLSGPDGAPGTQGAVTTGSMGTMIDTYINFFDPVGAGTVGRIWDGNCQGGIPFGGNPAVNTFGVGVEAATSLGAANNAATTKLFEISSAIDQVTPTNYLTYRNIGREPAVWDYTPKQNDLRSINIEGFTYKPAGITPEEMIIGLRSPLTARTTGNAIYFRASNPISNFLPVAGGWTGVAGGLNTGLDQLNLNGLGIRGITWYAAQNTYLIVAGTANGGPLEKEVPNERHVLFSWDGSVGPVTTFGHVATPIVIIPDLRPFSARPEGISIITVNGQPRVVFAEDRFRATGYATRNVVHWPVSILGTTFQSQ